MEETIITPAEGETSIEVAPPEEIAKTSAEILEVAISENKKADTVGLDKYLDLRKENKELKKSIANLKYSIDDGATNTEISGDIDTIANRYDVDKTFLQQLVTTIRSETEKGVDEKLSARFGAEEKAEKIDKAFNKYYDLAIENMPEFANVANKEVIKALSLLPSNANKTFSTIIEDAYGNAIQGKRTIDTVKAGNGKEAEPLDAIRAATDPEYFREVMANPQRKAEYNAQMLKKGF